MKINSVLEERLAKLEEMLDKKLCVSEANKSDKEVEDKEAKDTEKDADNKEVEDNDSKDNKEVEDKDSKEDKKKKPEIKEAYSRKIKMLERRLTRIERILSHSK